MTAKHEKLKLLVPRKKRVDKDGKPVAPCTISFTHKISADVPPAATLTIKNIKAYDVKKGRQDPYLVFKLMECGDIEQVARTSAKQNELNPVWNETLTLERLGA